MRWVALIVLCVPLSAHAVKLTIKVPPPSVATADLARAITAAVQRHPSRPSRREIFSVAGPVDPLVIQLQLAASGYKTLIDRADELVVEASTGARITIRFTATGARVLMTAQPRPQPPVSGACVAIPHRVHEVDVQTSTATTRVTLETEYHLDLDGDGIDDALVPVASDPHACPDRVSWRVMIVRGTCGYDLGTIGPGTVSPLGAPDASGFVPLMTRADTARYGRRHVPEIATWIRTYGIDHGVYTVTSTNDSTTSCPACEVSRCQ